MMSGVAVGAGLLLPAVAHLPPAAVGFATGAGVAAPRGRQQQEASQPIIKFMTLGIASILDRLAYRLASDCADWCDTFTEELKDAIQLQLFAQSTRLHLRARHQADKAVLKAIEERYTEADAAIDHALSVQMQAEKACQQTSASACIPEQRRAPTRAEEVACAHALAEAAERCKQLLSLAYLHGRRSERSGLEKHRGDAVSYSAAP
jgi:hypothetical protein